jgi:3-hydroxyisobutyrate dehydrogenase-like beta-hydroxyacid dehydrogenase
MTISEVAHHQSAHRRTDPANAQAFQKAQRRRRQSPQIAVGFIGLGHMGTAMAANLAAAGYRVTAYVRRQDQIENLTALGVASNTEIASVFDCGVVISMLPEDAAVRDVVFGRQDLGIPGLAVGLKPGAIHLCMSTISTSMASQVGTEHVRRRQGYVAAPVFGNFEAAKARQLFIIAAGAASDVERCQPEDLHHGHRALTGESRQAAAT